ncbi:hypothetical protein M8J77_022342 [Diaphorina citri]|nr:hypothetical protein M8J77_022342 [Diaphorina citri]
MTKAVDNGGKSQTHENLPVSTGLRQFVMNDAISLSKFTFEEFFTFYKNLTNRIEVEKIFDQICGSSGKRKFMTATQFIDFLNNTQRDPRLNEILHPYVSPDVAKALILEYEPNKQNASRSQLSLDGFLNYLMSADNPVIPTNRLELNHDMDQPLSHYFINSSHNTYLTGHQLTGKSSVEMYRQCLLSGCRCVELDFWNGRTDEPVIVHGYTFVPEIQAKDVIEAIAESAFKTSDYPVILSFENHCNTKQQAKIAQYCRDYFKDMLLDTPLDSHKLEAGVHLPPPNLLKRKIIIKNKKKHHHHHKKKIINIIPTPVVATDPVVTTEETSTPVTGEEATLNVTTNGETAVTPVGHAPPLKESSKESSQDGEEEEEDDVSTSGDDEDEAAGSEDMKLQLEGKPSVDKVTSAKETEAGAEISALVNYVQPIHFISFENAEKKNRHYEMSSFDEKQATILLKERPIEFVNYNKHQLSRVYPAGTRFDSSNFMPQVFWNAGCQLVALNYQTMDLAMQLNMGIFEYNQRCGYLLKPEFMRRQDRRFDPFAESTVDGIIAGTVSVHVISAQFLTDRRAGVYVEVDMYGLPADTVRKKFRTKIVPNNAINPVFDEEPFVFKKVVLPDLASLRIAAFEDSGRLIGHRILPVVGLCPGYRHVGLRNEAGQPLPLATLFMQIVVKDYVPDGFSDIAEALANPIKYQTENEKRAKQLAVLTDELDQSGVDGELPEAEKEVKIVIAPKREHQKSLPDIVIPPMPGVPTTLGIRQPLGKDKRLSLNPAMPSAHMPLVIQDEHPVSGEDSTGETGTKTSPKMIPPPSSPGLNEAIIAESLEKLMENKLVKEKKAELEKKLESLKKKHEKEKNRILGTQRKCSQDSSRSKFSMSNRLVKRLSTKNLDKEMEKSNTTHQTETSECSESDGDVANTIAKLPRSQSERLLAVQKEHLAQEKDLQEKYHETIFLNLEKAMKTSQSNQMKTLRVLLEKETEEVMKRLQTKRREDVKKLLDKTTHREKDELVRMKREIASAMVEKGVQERVRLTQIYEKKKEELERQHAHVRQMFDEEKARTKAHILKEYEGKFSKFENEPLPEVTEPQ